MTVAGASSIKAEFGSWQCLEDFRRIVRGVGELGRNLGIGITAQVVVGVVDYDPVTGGVFGFDRGACGLQAGICGAGV